MTDQELLNKVLERCKPENRIKRNADFEKMKAEIEKDMKENPEEYTNALTGNDIIKLLLDEKNGKQEAKATLNDFRNHEDFIEVIKHYEDFIEFEENLPDVLKIPFYNQIKRDTETSKELFDVIFPYEKKNLNKLYKSTAKLNKELIDIKKDSLSHGDFREIEVGTKKKPALIYAKMTVEETQDFLNQKGVQVSDLLTNYDIDVLNAVSNIYENIKLETGRADNEIYFTLQDVYRVLTGTKNNKVSKKQLSEIERAINKLWANKIYINFEEQAKKWKIETNTKWIIDNLLSIKICGQEQRNGEIIPAFYFKDMPPVWYYSKLFNQIESFPGDILTATSPAKQIKHDTKQITFKNYILRRLADSKKEKEFKILYETIFKECNKVTDNRQQTLRNRNSIKKILDELKKKNEIANFTEYDENGKIIENDTKKRSTGIKIKGVIIKK